MYSVVYVGFFLCQLFVFSDFCFALICSHWDCAVDRRVHIFFYFSSHSTFVVIQYWHKLEKQFATISNIHLTTLRVYREHGLCIQIPLSFYAIIKNYIIFFLIPMGPFQFDCYIFHQNCQCHTHKNYWETRRNRMKMTFCRQNASGLVKRAQPTDLLDFICVHSSIWNVFNFSFAASPSSDAYTYDLVKILVDISGESSLTIRHQNHKDFRNKSNFVPQMKC